MKDIFKLVRPHLLKAKPYISSRNEYKDFANLQLDANENPFDTGFNRYPDPLQVALKKSISKRYGIKAGNIFLGNGSSEIIDSLIRLFCEPGVDHIITLPPTCDMYELCANISGVEVKTIPLTKDFQIDTSAILLQSNEQSKLLFICSPNNPSGNAMDQKTILKLATSFPGLTVLDEAYIDFSTDSSLVKALKTHPRLLILRTFSKAWGLAGIRLGMAFGEKTVIGLLNSIKPPHYLNILTQDTAQLAMENEEEVQDWISEIKEQRSWLSEQLAKLPFVKQVYPSSTNFLLVEMDNTKEVYGYLKQEGIMVRDCEKLPGCKGCLRITVGGAADNQWLIERLEAFSAPNLKEV